MSVDVKLDRAGTLMVPSKLRREVALRRLQEYMRKFKKPGESVVDEFLDERREEARREWPKK